MWIQRILHGCYKLSTYRLEMLACMSVKYRWNPKSVHVYICMLLVSTGWADKSRNRIHKCRNIWFNVSFGKILDTSLSFLFIVPKTEPIGDPVRYVKEGSRVALHCVISGAIDPPLYVIWYHYTQQIFPDNVRQWRTEISHQQPPISKSMTSNQSAENRKTVSIGHYELIVLENDAWKRRLFFFSIFQVGSLIMPSVQKKDSGNFTCSPSNSADVTIVLNVINGTMIFSNIVAFIHKFTYTSIFILFVNYRRVFSIGNNIFIIFWLRSSKCVVHSTHLHILHER